MERGSAGVYGTPLRHYRHGRQFVLWMAIYPLAKGLLFTFADVT